MSTFFQLFISSMTGIVAGSLVFGLWLCSLVYFQIYVYGGYGLGNSFFGGGTIEKPIFWAFVIGLIFGSVQGFITGQFINFCNTSLWYKGALIGLLITEFLIFALIFLINYSNGENPIVTILAVFIEDLYGLIKISLILFVPSIITGAAITKVISFITSR